jgi:preprotein translocase subunit SecE
VGRGPAQQSDPVAGSDARDGAPRDGEGSAAGKLPRAKGGGTGQHQAGSADGRASTAPKGKPTPARDRGPKGPSLYERFVRYLREVVGELRKVVWPTRKQMLTYTVVVLIFLTLVTAFIFGIDLGFSKMMVVIFS